MKQTRKELIVIAGASKGIGKHFFEFYSQRAAHVADPQIQVVGITRKKNSDLQTLDLSNSQKTAEFVKTLPQNLDHVLYIHSVGIDKFEPDGKPHIDRDGDGIDDDVYCSNVQTYFNIIRPLIAKTRSVHTPLTICSIGGLSDSLVVPFWQSFSRAKNLVRQHMRYDDCKFVNGVFFNVSSVLAHGEKYGRPLADTAYWLPVNKFIDQAIPCLNDARSGKVKYSEFDFMNPSPFYTSDYFTNLPKLYATWQRDMGFANKRIPHGIRI